MIRCVRCIYPVTRPEAHFDADGVCSACRAYEQRAAVDWSARLDALKALIAESKARKAPYDVVCPVSGGKDSTAQVLTLVDLGAKVLAVNSATDMLTPLGRRNLDNIKRFCDVIEVTPHIEVRKRLIRLGLQRIGDLSFPEHCAVWAIPTRMAVLMGVPYCVWGEMPQREYSCPDGVEPATNLDGAWVAQFGGMGGLRLQDLVGELGLTARDLEVFRFPPNDVLARAGVRGIWLGDYTNWCGWKNAFIAQHHGFELAQFPVETSLGTYENLDNFFTVPRDFIRTLKFGLTRGTDIACNHIRRGMLSREEGLALEAKTFVFPHTSLGKPLAEVLAYADLTMDDYLQACRHWMNPEIFSGFDDNWNPILRKVNGSSQAHHTSPAQ